MKVARRVLAIAILLSLGGALASLLTSDTRLFWVADRFLRATTAYHLEAQGLEISWHPLHVKADLLAVQPDDMSHAPLFSASGLDVTTSLGALLSGNATLSREGRLHAENLTLFIDYQASGPPPDPRSLLASLDWLPASADIRSLHLISRDENVWVFPLFDVSARHGEDGEVAATGEALLGNRPIVLEVRLSPTPDAPRHSALDVLAEIGGRDDEDRLQLEGRVEARSWALHYVLDLGGEYARIGDFLHAFDAQAVDLDGRLQLAGQLSGNIDDYVLQLQSLRIDSEGYHLDAAGTLSGGTAGPARMQIDVVGDLLDSQMISALPQRYAEALQRGNLALSISGELRAPRLDRALIVAQAQHATWIRVESAAADFDELVAQRLPGPAQLRVAAPDTRGLSELLDLPLPGTGEISLDATLSMPSETGDVLRIDALRSSLSLDEGSQLAIDGSVEYLGLNDESATARGMEGIDLHVVLNSDGIAELMDRFGLLTEDAARPPLGRASLELGLQGSVADLNDLAGVALNLDIAALQLEAQAGSDDIRWLPLSAEATGRLRRAAERWQLRDLVLTAGLPDGAKATLAGQTELSADGLSGDLRATASAAAAGALPLPGPLRLQGLEADLRLTPHYATVLGALHTAHEPLQLIVSADLAQGRLKFLAADLYTRELQLADLTEGPKEKRLDTAERIEDADWASELPRLPLDLSLRADNIVGSHTELESLRIEVSGRDNSFILRHFDAGYAGGLLELRGVIDTSSSPPRLSLAGRGDRFPLGAILEDLALDVGVTGELSLRGGISTSGADVEALLANLDGRLAVAVADAEVRGPAYDLLMSDLLAWITTGAGERTTQFDCTMAQFDFGDGIADSDNLFMETPRMLATGDAAIDLREQTINLRLEPRSRRRSLQFPSAVRISGPLADPKVRVSRLQTTFDASARILWLLPELTLQLFGLRPDGGVSTPCGVQLQ